MFLQINCSFYFHFKTDNDTIAKLLIDNGVSTKKKNLEGKTAHDCAKPAFRGFLSRDWEPMDINVTQSEEFEAKLNDNEVSFIMRCCARILLLQNDTNMVKRGNQEMIIL